MKHIIFILLFFYSSTNVAQELNCKIVINTDQLQGSVQTQIFTQLKQSATEFLNNTKWTKDVFTQQEKIDCQIQIIIKQMVAEDTYAGSIQVVGSRPVYKSSYNTQIFNCEDNDFTFLYQQFTTLDFNLNSYTNNLTSVLAFYAYVILASDYDTFSPLGGTELWQKAQLVVASAQNSSDKGWHSSEGFRNRFWLVDNTLQPLFQGIRDCMYQYNKNGLDIMWEKPDEGRAVILKSLDLLKPVAQNRPASFNMQLFFNAKSNEIINIFKNGQPDEKTKVTETLSIVDPANTTNYLKINGG
ncbi:MAG: DUF4835 family protein [Bacteroidetes bacterium]|nr:DUF4835 family protein [Bacteroidota bacterium]